MKKLIVAVVALSCLASACTKLPASDKEETATPTPPTSAGGSSKPEDSSGPAAGTTASTGNAHPTSLDLPKGHKVLIPAVSGNGDKKLPSFEPPSRAYTVLLVCKGKGNVTLRVNGEDKPNVWPCDGVVNFSVMYVQKVRQSIAIEGRADAAWSAAVVDGDA